MNLENININDAVVYMPLHLGRKISDENLGIVTSKNDKFVFVKYLGKEISQATRPEDLFTLKNRPDLKEKLGIEIKPIDRLHELYLEEKEALVKKVL